MHGQQNIKNYTNIVLNIFWGHNGMNYIQLENVVY